MFMAHLSLGAQVRNTRMEIDGFTLRKALERKKSEKSYRLRYGCKIEPKSRVMH